MKFQLADEDEAEDSEEEVVPGHLTSYYEVALFMTRCLTRHFWCL